MNALPVGLGDILEVEISPLYAGRMGAYQLRVERVELVEPIKLEPGDFSHGLFLYPYPVIHLECSHVGRRHDRGYYTILPQPKGDWLSPPIYQRCPGYSWAFKRMHIVKRAKKKREKKFTQGELFA